MVDAGSAVFIAGLLGGWDERFDATMRVVWMILDAQAAGFCVRDMRSYTFWARG